MYLAMSSLRRAAIVLVLAAAGFKAIPGVRR
jgi:hypothetical protein